MYENTSFWCPICKAMTSGMHGHNGADKSQTNPHYMTHDTREVEEIVDTVFQAVMTDIRKYYVVSDRLADVLSESLPKHLARVVEDKNTKDGDLMKDFMAMCHTAEDAKLQKALDGRTHPTPLFKAEGLPEVHEITWYGEPQYALRFPTKEAAEQAREALLRLTQ